MNLQLKPVSFIKKIAAGLSVVTMCISPLAQGAEASNQKKLINQYLKQTGLTTKKMTVGEYWKTVRHVYPQKLQAQMDIWVASNRNEMMPTVDATSFKDSNGVEQVRLTLSSQGQSVNLTFTGDNEKPLKVNGVSLTRKELTRHSKFNELAAKIAQQDPSIGKSLQTGAQGTLSKNFVLTYKEFSRLTARQKAEYFIRLRYAAEAAQNVYKTRYGAQALNELNSKYEWAFQALFGEPAHAASALTGKPCIVAGYITKYGENGSCGGDSSGKVDLNNQMSSSKATCGGTSVSCNPMVYGFNASGGAHCIERSQVKYATRECNKKSPLQDADPRKEGENKKRIVESYLKKVKGQDISLVLNEDGKISQEQYAQVAGYFDDLQAYVNAAIQECGQAPLKDIKVSRQDQDSACEEIKTRAFSLQAFANQPQPFPGGKNCDEEKPGSVDQGGSCVCPEGTREGEQGNGRQCVVVGGTLPGGKEPLQDNCGFWCKNKGWIIPVGVGVAALGLFWWLMKDKDKKSNPPEYIPPAPVDPDPLPSPTPTVTPSPTPTCNAPNVMIGGICTPPVIVPPPAEESEGGTQVDIPGRGGGVR